MGKDFQRQLNRLYVLLDALVIAGAYLTAWWVLFGNQPDYGVLPFSVYFRALLFILPSWLLLYGLFGLYSGQLTEVDVTDAGTTVTEGAYVRSAYIEDYPNEP